MAKLIAKTVRGQEQCHVNGYTLGQLRGQAKRPTVAPIRLPLEFCIFAKRLFYENTHVIDQVIAALRRSVGLLGRFVTVLKNLELDTHTHTHTHTHNYCNPAADVRWGLMNGNICSEAVLLCYPHSLLCSQVSREWSYVTNLIGSSFKLHLLLHFICPFVYSTLLHMTLHVLCWICSCSDILGWQYGCECFIDKWNVPPILSATLHVLKWWSMDQDPGWRVDGSGGLFQVVLWDGTTSPHWWSLSLQPNLPIALHHCCTESSLCS